jgi:tetratricopeptide (TPR) repeat protein
MQDGTLLRQLITERGVSYPEACEALRRKARALGLRQFDLSERHFVRLVNGQVKTRPQPSTCRVLEAEFGHSVDDLLGNPGPEVEISRPPERAMGRSLDRAAQASAGYALWQGIDGISVGGLQLRLGQLAQDYVHGEMLPVVDGICEVREFTVEMLPRAGAHQRSLYLLAGLSSAMLAHAAGNLGQLAQAPAHAQAALRFAELGNLPGVAAWATAVLALQLEWSGSPQRSLVQSHQARSYLSEDSPDSTTVWLSAIEARAYARLGDATAARSALDRAVREREAITRRLPGEHDLDQFGGIVAFGEAKQHYYAGTALRRIGDMPRARTHAAAAISAYESGPADQRSYGDETLARLDLAIAHALGDGTDLDAVTDALDPVTQLPEPLLLPTMLGHLGELAEAVSRPEMRHSKQAAQVRNTAMALSAMCTPRPAQITS